MNESHHSCCIQQQLGPQLQQGEVFCEAIQAGTPDACSFAELKSGTQFCTVISEVQKQTHTWTRGIHMKNSFSILEEVEGFSEYCEQENDGAARGVEEVQKINEDAQKISNGHMDAARYTDEKVADEGANEVQTRQNSNGGASHANENSHDNRNRVPPGTNETPSSSLLSAPTRETIPNLENLSYSNNLVASDRKTKGKEKGGDVIGNREIENSVRLARPLARKTRAGVGGSILNARHWFLGYPGTQRPGQAE